MIITHQPELFGHERGWFPNKSWFPGLGRTVRENCNLPSNGQKLEWVECKQWYSTKSNYLANCHRTELSTNCKVKAFVVKKEMCFKKNSTSVVNWAHGILLSTFCFDKERWRKNSLWNTGETSALSATSVSHSLKENEHTEIVGIPWNQSASHCSRLKQNDLDMLFGYLFWIFHLHNMYI